MSYTLTKVLLGGPSPLLFVARGESQERLAEFHAKLGTGHIPAGMHIAMFLASVIDDDDIIVIPLEHFGAQLQTAESTVDDFPNYLRAAEHAKRRIMEAMEGDKDEDDDDLGSLVPQGNA